MSEGDHGIGANSAVNRRREETEIRSQTVDEMVAAFVAGSLRFFGDRGMATDEHSVNRVFVEAHAAGLRCAFAKLVELGYQWANNQKE